MSAMSRKALIASIVFGVLMCTVDVIYGISRDIVLERGDTTAFLLLHPAQVSIIKPIENVWFNFLPEMFANSLPAVIPLWSAIMFFVVSITSLLYRKFRRR